MRQTVDFSSAEFGLSTETSPSPREPLDGDKPFKILVLADFSGAARRAPAYPARKPLEIDADTFDDVMELLAPTASVTVPGGEARLAFRSLDDFHPDSLYRTVPAFRDSTRDAFL